MRNPPNPNAPGRWDVRPEGVLPGLESMTTRYVVVNTQTGEERGRPTSWQTAKAHATQLNREKKSNG